MTALTLLFLQDEALREGVRVVGAKNWKRIAAEYLANSRTRVQCRERWQKVLRPGLVKGPYVRCVDHSFLSLTYPIGIL